MVTEDAIAHVLITWLAEHGYPVADPDTALLVPLDWLMVELADLHRRNPTSDRRAVAAKRWDQAVTQMERLLRDYAQRALSVSPSVRSGEARERTGG